MATEIIAVRLAEDVLEKIDLLAEKANFNRSEWLRAIIFKELASKEQDWSEFLEEQLEVLLKVIPLMSRQSQARIYRVLPSVREQLFELPLNEKKELAIALIESLVKSKSKGKTDKN